MTDDNSDLEKLVDMAEEVSSKISDLNDKISKLKNAILYLSAFMFMPFTLSYFLPTIDSPTRLIVYPLIIVGGIFFVAGLFYIILGIRRLRDLTDSKKLEQEILHDLLNMIHEYRIYLHSESASLVANAILDMRLKRIEYSGRW